MVDITGKPHVVENFEENKYLSPSDKLKQMIMQRYDQVGNFYVTASKVSYERAIKFLGRLLYILMDEEERKIYDEFNTKEEEIIKQIKDSQKSGDQKEREISEKTEMISELRLNFLTVVLSTSTVIQRDIEVDFIPPKTMEDFDKLRDIVKEELVDGKSKRIL